jgi:hypothetical protein
MSFPSRIYDIRQLWRFLAASVVAWKSPAPSPPARNSCSSTSPSPELIRLRSVIYASWCDSLPLGASGCLLTDHNVRETLELIDRALIIHEGEVLTEGTPTEIVNNADVRRFYLGEGFSL